MNRQCTRIISWIGLTIGTAAMLFPAQAPATPAHASGVDLGALMARALDRVHSFKIVSDSTTTGATASSGGVMRMHFEEILIRRGTGFAMSMQTMIDGRVSAVVYTGTHMCLKRTATVAWDCSVPPAYVKSYTENMDPVKAFKASGVVTSSVASVGTKSVQGQPCAGYRYAFLLQASHLSGHGTMWFSSATGRVVEVDGVSTAALVAGRPPMVITSTGTYSRWDDPSLRLPAVPAS